MDIFAQSRGLLHGDDRIRLADGIHVEENKLLDDANGARHIVSDSMLPLILDLRRPVRLADWLALNRHTEFKEKYTVLCVLDDIAALHVERSLIQALRVWSWRIGFRMKGVRLQWNAKRFRGRRGLINAVWKSTQPLVVSMLFLGLFAYGANVVDGQFLLGQLLFLCAVYGSTVIHEFVHWATSGGRGFFVVRGLRIGLLHTELQTSKNILSAVLGPVCGAVCCLLIMISMKQAGLRTFDIASVGMISLAHLVSWLPGYGDGAVLVAEWRIRHAKTA